MKAICWQGLTAVVSVKVPEPEFEGQTKNRLGNPEVRGIVDSIVGEELVKLFEWHPKVANDPDIVRRCIRYNSFIC